MVWRQLVADDEQEKEAVSLLEEGKFYTRGNSDALNAFLAQITGKDKPKVLPASNYTTAIMGISN